MTLQSVGPFSIHRTKGRIVTDAGVKMVQGVREVFEIVNLEINQEIPSQGLEKVEKESSKLVLIGRGLQHNGFQKSLDNALDDAAVKQ